MIQSLVLRRGVVHYPAPHLLPTGAPSSSSALFSSPNPRVSHDVDGFACTEVHVSFGLKGIDNIVILEADADAQEQLIALALSESSNKDSSDEDPYGSVLWPAAKTVSLRLLGPSFRLEGKHVLELGTGTGLVSLAAALGGAASVLATDYNLFSLALLERAKTLQKQPVKETLTTRFFDVKDLAVPLPDADVVLVADMLYDPVLASAVGKRVCEAYRRGSHVIVGNSPGRPGTPNFLDVVRDGLGFPVAFTAAPGYTVTGYRDPLISGTNTAEEKPLDTTILELCKGLDKKNNEVTVGTL